MLSQAERDYQTHDWEELLEEPSDVRSLNMVELTRFCNSDSQAFQNLIARQRGFTAFLIDYELLSLDLDPRCGSLFLHSESQGLVFIVFTEAGSRIFVEKKTQPSI